MKIDESEGLKKPSWRIEVGNREVKKKRWGSRSWTCHGRHGNRVGSKKLKYGPKDEWRWGVELDSKRR